MKPGDLLVFEYDDSGDEEEPMQFWFAHEHDMIGFKCDWRNLYDHHHMRLATELNGSIVELIAVKDSIIYFPSHKLYTADVTDCLTPI